MDPSQPLPHRQPSRMGLLITKQQERVTFPRERHPAKGAGHRRLAAAKFTLEASKWGPQPDLQTPHQVSTTVILLSEAWKSRKDSA